MGVRCVYKVILLHNLQKVIHGISLVKFSTDSSQTCLLWNNTGSPQPLLHELLYLNQGTLEKLFGLSVSVKQWVESV